MSRDFSYAFVNREVGFERGKRDGKNSIAKKGMKKEGMQMKII